MGQINLNRDVDEWLQIDVLELNDNTTRSQAGAWERELAQSEIPTFHEEENKIQTGMRHKRYIIMFCYDYTLK